MKKKKIGKGIMKDIIIGMVPISIIAAVIIYVILGIVFNNSNKMQIESKILSESLVLTTDLNNWIDTHGIIVKSFESSFASAKNLGLQKEEYAKFLNRIVEPFGEFLDLYYWDNADKIFYSAKGYDPGSDYDGSTRPWHISAMKSDVPAFCDPYVDVNTGNVCVTASIKVKDKNNNVVGVMGGDICITELQDILDEIHFTDSAYGLLINTNDGSMIGNSDKELEDADSKTNITDYSEYKTIANKLLSDKQEVIYFKKNGRKMIASLDTLVTCPWKMAVISTNDDMKQFVNNSISFYINIAILGIVIVLVLYIIIFIRNNLEHPIDRILSNLSNNFKNIKTLSNELTSSSVALSSNTKMQRNAIELTETNMNETTSTIEQNTKSTQDATNASNSATSSAMMGSEKLKRMQETVQKLKESSTEIKTIIKVIDDIAFQTNILALNASVEAARAGDAGKGFEVVAEEVRNLAAKSTIAAKNISEIIQMNIQYSDECSRITDDATTSLEQIVENSKYLNEIISNISDASIEQSKSIDEVSMSITDLEKLANINEEKVVTKNSQIVETIEKELSDLNSSINELNVLLNGK